MQWMKKLFIVLAACILLVAGVLYATADSHYPALQDGDLIFQTSTSSQSTAILVATANRFTHMGMINMVGKDIVVIEAAGTVKETPLAQWVKRGLFERVAIYRDPALTPAQAKQIIAAAKGYYGKPYDLFFSFHNDAIYCSELPYLAYRKAGITIGTVQKIADLNFDNAPVRKLIARRWQRHAECQAKHYDFAQCYDYILHQELVTPASIAKDARFTKIYSNYPF
ncbi:MAG: YiiX/YebB-like N1pC/P60 family cysteine hydrolase [Pseudomonadota bacterium]